MPQVSVRDTREDDRGWIQNAYRDYLVDLAPSATGLYPMLGDLGAREPDPLARLSADANAHLLTVCYAEERAGFAKINALARRQPPGPRRGSRRRRRGRRRCCRSFRWQSSSSPGRGGAAASVAQAVRLILDRFTGRWLITEHVRNDTGGEILAARGERLYRRQVSGAHRQR